MANPNPERIYNARNATEYATIANYVSTIRTNADLQSRGIQTTAFATDGAGVPTSYSDNLLQFNGDGRYVDTNFMPPSDKAWEIDFVMETKADGTLKASGAFNTNKSVFIAQSVANGLYGQVGTKVVGSTSTAVADGLHYIRIEFNGAGAGNFVIDNTITYPFSLSDYVYSALESFFIGGLSTDGAYSGFPCKTPAGQFQYKLGTRTTDERNTYYVNLKTIYPTLP